MYLVVLGAHVKKFEQSYDSFRLLVLEPAIRSYLQHYPFANGPDPILNAKCYQIIRDQLMMRNHAQAATIVQLLSNETRLTEEQMSRLERIMDESELPTAVRPKSIDDFAWEANLVPCNTKNALVL